MIWKRDTVTHYSIKQKPRGEQNVSEFYDGGEIDDEVEEDRSRASCGFSWILNADTYIPENQGQVSGDEEIIADYPKILQGELTDTKWLGIVFFISCPGFRYKAYQPSVILSLKV